MDDGSGLVGARRDGSTFKGGLDPAKRDPPSGDGTEDRCNGRPDEQPDPYPDSSADRVFLSIHRIDHSAHQDARSEADSESSQRPHGRSDPAGMHYVSIAERRHQARVERMPNGG